MQCACSARHRLLFAGAAWQKLAGSAHLAKGSLAELGTHYHVVLGHNAYASIAVHVRSCSTTTAYQRSFRGPANAPGYRVCVQVETKLPKTDPRPACWNRARTLVLCIGRAVCSMCRQSPHGSLSAQTFSRSGIVDCLVQDRKTCDGRWRYVRVQPLSALLACAAAVQAWHTRAQSAVR